MPARTEQGATLARPPVGRGRVNVGIFGLLIGMFLGLLDSLILSSALPTVVGELGGWDLLSWVITAYLLATAATTPIWGKLGDLYGRTTMFKAAIILFLAGSALCGLAQSMGQLVAFRAVQGLGAGGLMVGAMATIGVLVPPRENGRVQSMIGIILPIAFVGGPLVGGVLTDHLGWRWAFYVNIPIGIVALLLVNFGIRLRTERIRARIDFPGAILLTAGVLALTLLTSLVGTSYGWSSPPIVALGVISALALGGFVFVERRAAEPVIPPRLFHDRNFTLSQILSFLVGAAMLATMNYLPQYMQFAQGMSPAAGGLLALPLTAGMFGAQLVTGHLISRSGRYRRYPIIGGAVMAAGAMLMLMLDENTDVALASSFALVAGVGMGLLVQSTLLITTNSANARDMGAASGTVILLRMIGGSLGISLLGAVYASRLLDALSDQVGAEAAHRLANGAETTPAVMRDLPEALRNAFQAAVTDGMHGLLVGVALLAAVAFAVSWFLREVPLRTEAMLPNQAVDKSAEPA